MKYMLLLLCLLFSLSITAQENHSYGETKVDTIHLPFKNPFKKKANASVVQQKVVEVHPQSYYLNKSGHYLRQSANIQYMGIGCAAAGGILAAFMSDTDKPIWAVPITLGACAVACEIYSIALRQKAGYMLTLAAGTDGAKLSLNF